MKQNHIKYDNRRICYIKSGDVVNELSYVLAQSNEISGGPNYYVYSTKTLLEKEFNLLYLSLGQSKKSLSGISCQAKSIKKKQLKNKILTFFFSLPSLLQLYREICRFRPHHIICVKRPLLLVAYLAAKKIDACLTVSVHTDMHVKNLLNNFLETFVLFKTDSVICHGPYLKNQVIETIGTTTKVVEYNASCKDIVSLKRQQSNLLGILKNRMPITFIGRMEKTKGVYDLYEACRPLLKQDHRFVLCYAGAGSECTGIAKCAQKDNLAGQVIVFDKLEREYVAELLRYTWVAVMPTRKEFPEGRCMAAMEALAMGVPVIVPDFGPFPFLVEDEINGLLYKPNSVEYLREKLFYVKEPIIRKKLSLGASKRAHTFSETDLSYGEAVKKCINECRK